MADMQSLNLVEGDRGGRQDAGPREETEPNGGESESEPQSKRSKRTGVPRTATKRTAAPEFSKKNAFYKFGHF